MKNLTLYVKAAMVAILIYRSVVAVEVLVMAIIRH